MSMDLSGVGLRLLEIRKRQGVTQPVMAAKLDIGERTYKSYELGQRELPTSVAAEISVQFDVQLSWLLLGEGSSRRVDMPVLLENTVICVLDLVQKHKLQLESARVAKISRKVFEAALLHNSNPEIEAAAIFDLIL